MISPEIPKARREAIFILCMAKSMWTPDHHTYMQFFPKLFRKHGIWFQYMCILYNGILDSRRRESGNVCARVMCRDLHIRDSLRSKNVLILIEARSTETNRGSHFRFTRLCENSCIIQDNRIRLVYPNVGKLIDKRVKAYLTTDLSLAAKPWEDRRREVNMERVRRSLSTRMH